MTIRVHETSIVGDAGQFGVVHGEPTEKSRFFGLDFLRGWGALAILLLHIGQTFGSSRIVSRGYLAVDMFFLLSGFVLDHTYGQRLASRRLSLGDYIVRRLRRLYPMIALGVGIGAACVLAGAIPRAGMTAFAVLDFLIVPSMLSSSYVFVLDPPEWSLFFELVANCVQGLLAPFLNIRLLTISTVTLGSIFLWAVLRNRTADVGTMGMNFAQGFSRVGFGFFAGVLLHRFWASGWAPRWTVTPPAILSLFPASILLAGLLPHSPAVDAALIFVLFPVLVWVGASTRLVGPWRKLAIYGGSMSYPLYALHHPLVTAAGTIMARQNLSAGQRCGAWVAFAAILCATSIWLDRNQGHLLGAWKSKLTSRVRLPLPPLSTTAP